jgi:hypothetical protein
MAVPFDGGGNPRFRSFHDFRMFNSMVGPQASDTVQFRAAFEDFKLSLMRDRNWTRHFTPSQVQAIHQSIQTNNPRIQGFVWHHDTDHGLLQLVDEKSHRETAHYGGRFTTGGRR